VKRIFKEVNSINYEKDEIFLLKDFLLNNLETDIKYRFLHLELNLLLLTFPEFKKIMEEQLKNEIKMIKKLLNHQISYGYIKSMNENEINFLVSNSWIIATNNLSYWNLLSNNLISNAIKYTNRSTHIKINIHKHYFQIIDEGKGMTKEEISKIFQRYTRFDEIQGGFGLGYNIIYSIIKEYNLKIKINSKINEGTCVKISW